MDKNTAHLSDEELVQAQKEESVRARQKELEDLRTVLGTQEGRRFVWRLLSHCKVFNSIWNPSASIHYNAGKQDVGHFVMGEVVSADEEFLFKMMRETKGESNV